MFGRKLLLPIDALLGATEDDIGERLVDEWVREHREHLTLTYAQAKRNLGAAALHRAQQKPEGTVTVLPEGMVVYRKNHVQGRNKIQNVWDSTRYRVVKCLDEAGRVYTICPSEDSGPERNVDRTELRVSPTVPAPGPLPANIATTTPLISK